MAANDSHPPQYRFGVATLEGVLERLDQVEVWNLESKNALRILHERAHAERAARSARVEELGPYERLERQLFGDPSTLLSHHEEHELGFGASLIEGPDIDLFALAGLHLSPYLQEALDDHNWQSILLDCYAAECMEVDEQDDLPGMSDVFYWVCVEDPVQLARQIREFVASLS